MVALADAALAGGAFAAPDKCSRIGIPRMGRCFKPIDQLLGGLGMQPVECVPFEDALPGFGHADPPASERGKEYGYALRAHLSR
ncbi:MAG: hypothetical protein PVSMB4_12890 [Ktedonobacterales bacterium]